MHLRPAVAADLTDIHEIDATVESSHYLHVECSGDLPELGWRLGRRPLREKQIYPNPLTDELAFTLRQIATGGDEGTALLAEHDDLPVALLLAQPRPATATIELLDLRVDSDLRRQGIATVLLFNLIDVAQQDKSIRAIHAQTLTNNDPATSLLQKTGFELSGLDLRRQSNHDLVKESATLLWYLPIVGR